MQTWKFTIKPGSDDGYDPFQKCKELGLVGIGWSHGYENQQPDNYEEAKNLIKSKWGKSEIKEVKKLFFGIKAGDHLWLQKKGHYYLCVAGSKQYLGRNICEDFRRYDLGHAIDAKWLQVPDELVCGSVQRGTIAQRMIQRIKLSSSEIKLNKLLEMKLTENPKWFPKLDLDCLSERVKQMDSNCLFGIMSPDDVEDIIALKLQTEGWFLLKSTCFRSKPQFEFSMTNCEGKTALIQVKSGRVPAALRPEKYKSHLTCNNMIYLFSTNPCPYPGEQFSNIICVDKNEIKQWVTLNHTLLSQTMKLKLSLS